MKLYNLIIAFVCLMFIVSCGNEYDTEEYFDLEELPGYVAFDADGNSINVPARDVAEGGGVVSVIVEHPTELLSDATVNYSLGGTAVFGEDYVIDGATASGGSMTISSARGDVADTYRGSIVIAAIDDAVFTGDLTIVLTLTSASNSEGEIAVGRGGTDFQKETTVTIIDDECDSPYGGMYSVVTEYSLIDSSLVDSIMVVENYTTNIDKTGDFTYTIGEASGGLFTAQGTYGMMLGTSGFSLDLTEDCGGVTFPATDVDLGRTIMDAGSSVDADGVFTISVSSMEVTMDTSIVKEAWVSTYTPM